MTNEPLHRGDMVLAVLSGDYGKPRPAVVVQADLFNEAHASIVLCPASSELTALTLFRIPIKASESNGLVTDSEVMIDKIVAAKRERIRRRIGELSSEQMRLIDQALLIWLQLPSELLHFDR